MQKFCTSCGAELSEGAKICSNCGSGQIEANSNQDFSMDSISAAPVEPAMQSLDSTPTAEPMMSSFEPTPTAQPTNPIPYSQVSTATAAPVQNSAPVYYSENVAPLPPFAAARSSQKPKLIFVLIGVIVALVIFFATSGGIGSDNGPYTKPVKDMVSGMEKGDWDLFISAFPPKYAELANTGIQMMGVDKDIYLKEAMKEELGDDYGNNLKIKIKVVSKKEIKGADLDAAEKKYNSQTRTEETFEKVYELKIKENIKGDKTSRVKYEKIRVAQIDGKWYIADTDVD